MAVTVAQVRTQISDRPQIYPPQSAAPEIVGYGDGTQTIFALTYENAIPGTLTVYEASAPAAGVAPVFTAIAATAYAVGAPSPGPNATAATNQIVTFAAAPAAGSIVGARYQATAFSDADLAAYLSRATATYGSDDTLLLKRVHFDLIDVVLSDQRRLEVLSQGDFKRDPAAFTRTLLALKESLRKDLAGGPRPGADAPALMVGVAGAPRYLPWR